MLAECGVKYVIVGHSERRQYFGETDVTVNGRLKAGLANGLRVILCVGETLTEREPGHHGRDGIKTDENRTAWRVGGRAEKCHHRI